MTNALRFGPFEFRPEERRLWRGSTPVPLGARAAELLLLLITNRHRVVGKAELLDSVWAGLIVEEANVHVQVSLLRKELGPEVIATVPGRGYRFVAPVLGSPAAQPSAPGAPGALDALPAVEDDLIDRDDDAASLRDAVLRHRVVSVLGPGGVGKTRLARRVGPELAPHFPQGVCWVEVASLSSAEQMLVAVAHATRVQLAGDGAELGEQLLLGLGERRLLLVLDNCEHLVEPAGHLIRALLARAPGIRVLVTSQEAPKIPGGHDFRLRSLTLPSIGASLPEALASGALQLLEIRAKAVERRFRIDEGNLADAIELVRRLDGNPLAIEMAAARAPVLGLAMLRQRLDERFRFLRGLPHAGDARHQTLQATLAWSDSLLGETERQLLQQLAVFAGSFRVDIVPAVCPYGPTDVWAVLDTLSSLVDKSLVQIESLEPPRYRLLDSVRLYFQSQLQSHGGLAAAEARHGAAMAAVGDEAEAGFWSERENDWLRRHAADYDDLQVAFDRACARLDADCAARTGEALLRLDHMRNVLALRRQRARALHALLPHADTRTSAIIWGCVASHGLISIEGVSRAEAAARAVDAWRRLNDPWRLHFALGFLASERARQHDMDSADALLAECQGLQRPDWTPRRLMWAASAASGVAIHRGDGAEYRRVTRLELSLADRAGAERAAAWSRLKLADAALMAGDFDEAITLGEAAVQALRGLDQPSNLGLALANLCAARLLARRPAAVEAATEALPLLWRTGWAYLLADSVALLAARAGNAEAASLLLGFADSWYARHEDARQPNEARLAVETTATLAAMAEPALLQSWRDQGRALDDAAAGALTESVLSGLAPSRQNG